MTGATAVVLFAGIGAETQAARDCGLDVTIAVNHDPRAIETHQANHPAQTVCADISQITPGPRYGATVLLASPECTHQTLASGKARGQGPDLWGNVTDPAAERSRATMWDVVRFAEAMVDMRRPYQAIVVENVAEILSWVLWPAWSLALRKLGYRVQVVSRDAAFDSTGQARPRAYVACTRTDRPAPDLTFRPAAPCPRCTGDVAAVQVFHDPRLPGGKYGPRPAGDYLYGCPRCGAAVAPYARPAAEVLDVDRPGVPIGTPPRLVPKSMARAVRAFAAWGPAGRSVHPRFTPIPGSREASALVVSYYSSAKEKGWPIGAPVRALTTIDRHALLTWPSPGADLGDCGYRMLSIAEMRRLTGLRDDYVLTGSGDEQTRGIGNAIVVPTFAAVLRPVLASIGAA